MLRATNAPLRTSELGDAKALAISARSQPAMGRLMAVEHGGFALLGQSIIPTVIIVTRNTMKRRSTSGPDLSPVAMEAIVGRIVFVRGRKVLLDADLAALYGVETRRLNEQVRRNAERFPADFMFMVTPMELAALMSQIATSNKGRGGRRKLPLAFTEHGALMAATVLNSPRARDVAVYVVRAFVQLRDLLASNKELAQRLKELEQRLEERLQTHDRAITGILAAIRSLMNPAQPKKRAIGFVDLEERGTK